jgi:hypothetical protein
MDLSFFTLKPGFHAVAALSHRLVLANKNGWVVLTLVDKRKCRSSDHGSCAVVCYNSFGWQLSCVEEFP